MCCDFKSKNMIRPGLDKLRYEHLKAFVGHLNEPLPDEERFCKNLACLITIILRGQEPSELLPALRDNEIIAIPKGHTDVRPIGIGLTFRKIASIAFPWPFKMRLLGL